MRLQQGKREDSFKHRYQWAGGWLGSGAVTTNIVNPDRVRGETELLLCPFASLLWLRLHPALSSKAAKKIMTVQMLPRINRFHLIILKIRTLFNLPYFLLLDSKINNYFKRRSFFQRTKFKKKRRKKGV